MKYKVGDRVKVKSLDWYNENKIEEGIIECGGFTFLPQMTEICGKIVTIKKVHSICYDIKNFPYALTDAMIEGLAEEEKKDMGEVSDGYHTFNELYEYRLLYNASMFNELAKQGLYDVHKSKRHSNGEIPFGDSNWFIVMAELPSGQISNHYEMKDWDLFQIPEKEKANAWDGHTPKDVAERIRRFLTPKPKYPTSYEECCVALEYIPYTDDIIGYKWGDILQSLQKLLICRDAYWKIAGDWKPEWKAAWKKKNDNYNLIVYEGDVIKDMNCGVNLILSFPTSEMRDTFYENFKDLINECKELL